MNALPGVVPATRGDSRVFEAISPARAPAPLTAYSLLAGVVSI
jgi:hypothetical protein